MFLALPPGAGLGFFKGVRKVVFEKACPDVPRRGVRKGICFHQAKNRGRTLKQPGQKIHEPWFSFDVIQSGKPHLPIQPRLMRKIPQRRTPYVARFVFKRVFVPVKAIIRALDNDLRPGIY